MSMAKLYCVDERVIIFVILISGPVKLLLLKTNRMNCHLGKTNRITVIPKIFRQAQFFLFNTWNRNIFRGTNKNSLALTNTRSLLQIQLHFFDYSNLTSAFHMLYHFHLVSPMVLQQRDNRDLLNFEWLIDNFYPQ